MRSFIASSALAAIGFANLARAGVAAVENKCGFPVYLWSVSDAVSNKIEIPDAHTVYNETYRSKNDNGGISIKISPTEEYGQDETQFEYTVEKGVSNPKVFYDLSNINGSPFSNVSYVLRASDPDCPVVKCAANDAVCKAVYNVWNDDQATHACDANADLIFTLCPDSNDESKGPDGDKTNDQTTDTNKPFDAATQPQPEAGSSAYNAVVNPDGSIGLKQGQPSATSPPVSNHLAEPATTSNKGDDQATKYVSWDSSNPTKRSVHIHQHVAHAEHSHQRLRRSRIFRDAKA